MAKSFKVQLNPTFKAAVKIPRVGAEPLAVTFEFKALNRPALAKVFDAWKLQSLALIQESQDAEDAGTPFTLTQWAEKEVALQVAQIKDVTVGWGFDDEFSDENIEELLNSSLSVTDVILTEYNDAFARAREGN